MTTRISAGPLLGGRHALRHFERVYGPSLQDALARQAASMARAMPLLDRPAGRTAPRAIWIDGAIDGPLAERVVAAISRASGSVEVIIDSPGGEVEASLRIADALLKSPQATSACILRADSSALWCCIGAGRVTAARDGSALVHELSAYVAEGGVRSQDELHGAAHHLSGQTSTLCDLMAKRTGETWGLWHELMRRGERQSAESLKGYNLVNTILPQTSDAIRASRHH